MRIALAQINSTLGDFSGNRQKIIEYTKRALEKHCDLVVFPELCLFGYFPADLLERDSAVTAQLKELDKLVQEMPEGIAAIVGLVTRSKRGKPYHNAAAFIQKGARPKIFLKTLLPTYDIFDESRFFEPGDVRDNMLRFKGKNLLITICEDIWGWGQEWASANYARNPLTAVKGKKIDYVININSSPYAHDKAEVRQETIRKTAKHFKAPLVYVNLVGGQDEVIYDGGSLVVDKSGKIQAQSIYFGEDLNVMDFGKGEGGKRQGPSDEAEELRQALVLGLRDFVEKNGFKRVHLGLSGGIDSAVVAALAVDALGPGRVSALALPGPFSASMSLELARKLAKNLGITLKEVSIVETYETLLKALDAGLGETPFGLVQENLQARIRGMILMAYSNKEHSLLLTTGNKSEYATGYTTLYGDMCGGLAPIADLVKAEVYDLAKYFNRQAEVIPAGIIERAPSAELRPNQKDQDTLPPYDELDKAVNNLVTRGRGAKNETESWVLRALFRSEFKRWQAPPILRVSSHAFGRGRRFPITNKALF
ncbi:MAG TPA: NAD+ synthase [Bdellovibrionales bacterium]|nr:NAD+ synthase [Bdellovibrionales bacterium]